ncbi:putative defense protein 3 isoform X3 [Mytilus edulis]|uniref:putative defense protein 3 isoform X3 n=1 Tax=Mytilus edulis TaxID=6550 RepID=UPI0039EEFEEF
MYSYFLTIYSLVLFVSDVNTYGSGAPAAFCQYDRLDGRNVILRPGHNARPRNPAPHGYRIETGQFNPQSLRVTLRAAPNDYFRGFFVQATRNGFPLEAINRPAYGTFRPLDDNSQARRCRAAVGGVGGITHTNNRDKNVVSFDWYPPASCNLGNVQFVATVVKQYNEYWVDVRSPNVTGVGFQGERGILCQLYNDPFNTGIQQEVIRLLSQQQQQQGQQQGQQQQARTAG